MRKEDLKKGVVYLYNGTRGADGANILFSPAEEGSFDYQGSILIHWSGNRVDISDEPNGYKISEYHLDYLTQAPAKGTEYYNKCRKAGKDVGGYSWHDSNEEKS